MTAPTRPVLRWHGGKWKLAPWILDYFPPHRVYVEPFGGAASMLLRKEPTYAEIYNDLDDEVVNLFRVLRSPFSAPRLITLLELTPFSRTEFEDCYELAEEPVEKAKQLIIRAYMGFGSNAHATTKSGRAQTGFRSNSSRSGTTPAGDWRNYPNGLPAVIDRLRGVIIEHRDARAVMKTHDGPDTLHYVDPPYPLELRNPGNPYDQKHMYRHEMGRQDHISLLAFLKKLTGMVVLSGYPSDLYDSRLKGWRRVETEALADGARKRTEVLWINPAACEALDRTQAPLLVRMRSAAPLPTEATGAPG